MPTTRESKGACPVCGSRVYVSNPVMIDGEPMHERCYAAWALGLAARTPRVV